MTTSDSDLLKDYVAQNSEDAFAALVHRHLNLVYSAALRQVRSPQLAEEVAQSVFADLARSAAKLRPETTLSAWLYQVTRRTAVDLIRRESRRQSRERIAREMSTMNSTASDWTEIEPLLDDAMEALDETDRTAILLRFFENRSLREVGQTIGTSEDAAQKRLSRAVERLRAFFSKRGVTVGANGLVAVISANAIQSAPIGLGAAVTAAATLTGSTITTVATTTATKTIAMTSLQKTLITATLVTAVGTGIYEVRQASTLRTQVQTLHQQRAPLARQLERLTRERDDARSKLAAMQGENELLRRNTAELPRLRGEVAPLRADSQELSRLKAAHAETMSNPTKAEMSSWMSRVNQLKQRLKQTPAATVPELQLVTEQDWLNAAKEELVTEADYRRAMSALRSAGERKFLGAAQAALRAYFQANQGQFPNGLSQLKPHFDTAVDEAMLQRYHVAPANSVDNVKTGGDWIITLKTPVDEDYDTLWVLGPNGFGSTTYRGSKETEAMTALAGALAPATQAFTAANGGVEPTDLSQLLPYIKTPEQQAAYQKLMRTKKARSK